MVASRGLAAVGACVATIAAQGVVWEHAGGVEAYRMIAVGGSLGDVDGDGTGDYVHRVETYLVNQRGFVETTHEVWLLSGRDGSRLRSRSLPTSPIVHLLEMVAAAGDVDRDGVPDYAFTQRRSNGGPYDVEVISGRNEKLLYQVRQSHFATIHGIDLCGALDVDGDSVPDLIMSQPTRAPYGAVIVASGRTGSELYTVFGDFQYRYEFRWQCLDRLDDIDGDGCDEFVVGVLDAVNGGGGAAIHSGRTGQRLRFVPALQWPAEAIGAGIAGTCDLDGDGLADFYASSHGHAGELGTVVAFSSGTGAVIRSWQSPQWNSGFGFAMRSGHDADRDGVDDLFLSVPLERACHVYSGRDGRRLVQFPALASWVDVLPADREERFPRAVWHEEYYGRYIWRGGIFNTAQGRTQCVRVVPAGVAVAGEACAGTLGAAPRIGWRSEGAGARVHLSDVPPGSVGVLLIGTSSQQWGSWRLPLDLSGFGLPGCALEVSVDATLATATGTLGLARGYGFVDVGLPLSSPGAAGAMPVHAQWKVLGPGGSGVALSERLTWWVAP